MIPLPTAVLILMTALAAAQDPAAGKAPPSDPTKAIEPLGGTRYRLGLMEFDKASRIITLPATVNMTKGLLEYVLVHESGKVHESLFSTKVKPAEFNVALLLLNWKPSTTFFDYTEPERGGVPVPGATHLPSSHLTIHLRWKDPQGKEQTTRIEDWIHNLDKKAKIEAAPFIYTGSRIMPDGSFLATETGSLIALMVDPASVINNPREGNELDDIWIPDSQLPAKGTEVRIELRPVDAPEEAKSQEPNPSSPPRKPGKSSR
ncbi:MAG: YdjY domain-containing protein [Verrucomicrobiota bacterium]